MAVLQLKKDLDKLSRSAKLEDAVQDVDKVIDLLVAAREKVAAGKAHFVSFIHYRIPNF